MEEKTVFSINGTWTTRYTCMQESEARPHFIPYDSFNFIEIIFISFIFS